MRSSRTSAAIALAATLFASVAGAIDQGDTAPPWSGVGFDGTRIDFPTVLDGKPAVVVFWATWCPYCRAFMPYLEKIQAEYGTDRITILMVNAAEDGVGDPRAYIDALGFPMVAVSNGDAIAADYGVEYIPGLMVIDAGGRVAYKRAITQMAAGAAVSSLWASQIRATLRRLLAD